MKTWGVGAGRRAGPAARRGWLAVVALVLALSPARAEEPSSGLRDALTRFLHDDAEAVVHVRSYFLDRTNPAPPNNAAWAGGG